MKDFPVAASAAEAVRRIEKEVSYLDEKNLAAADECRLRQCRLDLSIPAGGGGLPTLVWFHGGGFVEGGRNLAEIELMGESLIIAAAGYRLSPPAGPSDFLEDAAAATAWVLKNIAGRGGDPGKVFVGGHSAGGYLAALIGMDSRWLEPHGISNLRLAGIIPVSAQVTTHFLVKRLRGDSGPEFRPRIDEYAPLFHAAKELPPICLVLGDRHIEYPNRVEENELLAAALRNLGHARTEFHENPGLDHGTVIPAAWKIIPRFLTRVLAG